jgi:hypothetical protein
MIEKLIKGKVVNYISYAVLILAVTVFGSKSFIRPIFEGVIDVTSLSAGAELISLYLFSFSFSIFSFGLGALGVSTAKLVTKFSSLGEGGLLTEIKEHIILSVLVVTGAVLLLGLVWVI